MVCDSSQCRRMSLQLPSKMIDSNLMKRMAIYCVPGKEHQLI